jgi:hypothetical protein
MPIVGARAASVAVAILLGTAGPARAQWLPEAPLTLFGGRLVIGGEISGAIAPEDDSYFNYTDYEQNTLRLIRLATAIELRPHDRVSVLADVRTENLDRLRAFALYVKARPVARWPVNVVAGRIPPVFGAYPRRAYGSDLLIGYPLPYQYLTTLRPDALPAQASDLLDQRGRGWLVRYPVGDTGYATGVPLVSASRYDTGIGVMAASDVVEISAALTVGTLANPRVRDDNDGRQIAGRIQVSPWPALIVGASAARGEFLADDLLGALPPEVRGRTFRQHGFGADVEVSRDYWLLRGEIVHSRWDVPGVNALRPGGPLTATGVTLEGRYRISAPFYVAARVDHIGFSTIPDGVGSVEWDAPVTRVELGGGYRVRRSLLLKAAVQINRRDYGSIVTSYDGAALQAVYRF